MIVRATLLAALSVAAVALAGCNGDLELASDAVAAPVTRTTHVAEAHQAKPVSSEHHGRSKKALVAPKPAVKAAPLPAEACSTEISSIDGERRRTDIVRSPHNVIVVTSNGHGNSASIHQSGPGDGNMAEETAYQAEAEHMDASIRWDGYEKHCTR